MNIEKRKTPFGGSAGGGGYDYQAEAYALITAKILAQEGLNWPETGCDRVPVSARMETGTGGDDLRITLRSGTMIELQAKRGVKRSEDLWHALLTLAQAIGTVPNIYGVLLTTTDVSEPIRAHLRKGLIQLGQGSADGLHAIVEDLYKRLQDSRFTDLSICSRLRIVIRDFYPGSSGEEETLAALRRVIADPQMAAAARNTLVSDGMDLIKLRGRRDSASLAKVLTQASIPLSVSTTNPLVLREAFTEWSTRVNDKIVIPGLEAALPIAKAWARLRAMTPKEGAGNSYSITDQLRNDHEWHRLAENTAISDTLDIEQAARHHRLLVIVGGPGSG